MYENIGRFLRWEKDGEEAGNEYYLYPDYVKAC